MSGHRPWSEIQHKRDQPAWALFIRRERRPWWGLGLIVRHDEIEATRSASEEQVLAQCAALQGRAPRVRLELRRIR